MDNNNNNGDSNDENNLRERKKTNDDDDQSETTPLVMRSPPLIMKSPKEMYFDLLRIWVHQSNLCQNANAYFPFYLAANYPQLFQQTPPAGLLNTTVAASSLPTQSAMQQQNIGAGGNQVQQQNQLQIRPFQPRFPFFRNEDMVESQQRSEEIINQNGGYEFTIAPLWKRFAAEVVDAILLFMIKLAITFVLLELFDLNLGIDFNLDTLKNSMDDDYTEILSITSDLLLLEVLTKILVCIYEALWTAQAYGLGMIGGATPGKILLGIRILYVDAIVPLDPQPANLHNNTPIRALIFPIRNPGFLRAFARAVAKNVLMALLFPICFFMLFFKNNRTGYDIMTKTVVVEENSAPVLRRR